MATILTIDCSACGFQRKFAGTCTLVLDSQGDEHVCPHPGELAEAERVTGLSFKQLRQTGRLRLGAAALCPACGEIGHFVAPRKSIEAIRVRNKWLEGLSCRSCGAKGLLPGARNAAPPAGCATVGLLANAILWAPLLGHTYWAIPAVVALAVFVFWWVYLARKEKEYWASIACPACQSRGLSVAMTGRS